MDTGSGLYFHAADVDSRRLQEAFFSPASSDKPKVLPPVSSKKKYIWISALVVTLIAAASYLIYSYELIVVPKNTSAVSSAGSVIDNNVARLSLIGGDSLSAARITRAFTRIPLSAAKEAGLEINFKTPVNFNTHDILITLQNNSGPIIMRAVAKDIFFYSNVKQPERLVIDAAQKNSLSEVRLDLSQNAAVNVNVSKIQQVKLLFQTYSTPLSAATTTVNYYGNKTITIKNMVLVKKEGR